MSRLLIADDDDALCDLLKGYLSQEGFTVDTVNDGAAAVNAVEKTEYDLLILDVMMPKMNGFEALAKIRQKDLIPVIMLTARGEKVDRIVGLEMGADDYVAKPCDPRELVARIRAVTRRSVVVLNSAKDSISDTQLIQVDDIKLDPRNREVTLGDKLLSVTSTEFELLKLLLQNAGNLVARAQISESCMGRKLQPFDRSIDMHVSSLRKKLTSADSAMDRIKTVRGVGYQFLVWNKN